MTMTNENMQKIATLLKSNDPSSVEQGLLLIETLIDTEADFLSILRLIFETIPPAEEASLDDFSSFPTNLSTSNRLCLLDIWARLNPHVLSKNTTMNLRGERLSVLPESIGNLTNLTGLNLSHNQLTYLRTGGVPINGNIYTQSEHPRYNCKHRSSR